MGTVGRRWILLLVYLLPKLMHSEASFCRGVADNFTDIAQIREVTNARLIAAPSLTVGFVEWIFPNSLRFPCSGLITRWIFRAETPERITDIVVPQWAVYYENDATISDGPGDYNIRNLSGSLRELTRMDTDVYQYELNNPVSVKEGDVLGIVYNNIVTLNILRLSFFDLGTEQENPLSYRRVFKGIVFDAEDRFVQTESRYMPLVTAVMAGDPSLTVVLHSISPTLGDKSTILELPLPPSTVDTVYSSTSQLVPTPSPSIIEFNGGRFSTTVHPETSQLVPTPLPSTIEVNGGRFSTTLYPETSQLVPTPLPSTIEANGGRFSTTLHPETSQPSSPSSVIADSRITTDSLISATLPTSNPPKTTSKELLTTISSISPIDTTEISFSEYITTATSPSAVASFSSTLMIGIISGFLAIVGGIVMVLAVVVLVLRRRKHKLKDTSEIISPMDNPLYQVNPEDLNDNLEQKNVASHTYDNMNGNVHLQFGHSNETFALNSAEHNGHAFEVFSEVSLTNPQYQLVENDREQQFTSSVVCYELEPTQTNERREPEDYALPVPSGISTAEFQPYEVPVTAHILSKNLSSRWRESRLLDAGIYVPTERERKLYMSNASSFSNTSNDKLGEVIYSKLSHKHRQQFHKASFFVEEDIYWKPASSKTALYDQLATKKYREILRSQIQLVKHLGSGNFGTVSMGRWSEAEETIEVAVKTLIPQSTDEDKVKFLQEAAIMGQFLHPNVVMLYGVVTMGEPIMIVLEYMQGGDLRKYLLSKRPKPGENVNKDLPLLLLKFCREVANGMKYLSEKSFVHRDLAARNILVGVDTTCKIGDFGMSRDLEDNNYYITHGGEIPVKWTAPEALNFRKYSTASDVWSYGIVMYEMWSLGEKPFDGYSNTQAMQLIAQGFRLPPPPGCPRALYELMIRSWHSEAIRRPLFSAIVKMLSHSDSQLLSWNTRDRSVHPQVTCLGAPGEVSEELYQELQDYYSSKIEQI